MRRLLTTALTTLLLATAVLLGLGALAPAQAGGCGYGGVIGGGGAGSTGSCTGSGGNPGTSNPGHGGGGPTGPAGPPQPVYEDAWTPACMVSGPPGSLNSDVMCNGAATICDYQGQPDAIYMVHWQREVYPDQGTWTRVGNECRGPQDPVSTPPVVTQQMVVDSAYAAAPEPTAMVQPGNRSFVNIPNNYYADAQDQTVTITVLGHAIAVQFVVEKVTWDFGDGASGEGVGAKDAAVGAPGAVEHAYVRSGSYSITAQTTLGVRFTLPDGQQVDAPGAITMDSQPVVLPVSEVQTRVDATS